MEDFHLALEVPISQDKVFGALEEVEQFLEPYEIDFKVSYNLRLALEELLMNLCHHTDLTPEDAASVQIDGSGACLRLTVLDGGEAFDPSSRPDPDLEESLESRPIGGLGIYLITKTTSSFSYERRNEQNEVRLSWNLE